MIMTNKKWNHKLKQTNYNGIHKKVEAPILYGGDVEEMICNIRLFYIVGFKKSSFCLGS